MREKLWEEHTTAWVLCLRCPLAEWRGLHDPARRKSGTLVPCGIAPGYTLAEAPPRRKVVLMQSFPDPVQEAESSLWGANGEPPTIRALTMAFESLSSRVAFTLQDVGIISALGCRPANFNSPRRNRQVTVSMVGPCAPRWQLELMMMDPDLVIAMGHGAFAAINPRTPKVFDFYSKVGEGQELLLRGPGGRDLRYDVYVAPDVLQAAEHGTATQWAAEFDFKPPLRPSQEPVAHFRWHLYRALTIAEHLDRVRRGEAPSDEWGLMLSAQQEFHESRYSVQEALDEQAAWADTVRSQEMSVNNVRRAMLFDDALEEEPEDDIDLDDFDDDEEESDDEDED